MDCSRLDALFPIVTQVWKVTTPSPDRSLLARTTAVFLRAIASFVAFLVNIPLIPFIALWNSTHAPKPAVLEVRDKVVQVALPPLIRRRVDEDPPVVTLQPVLIERPVRDFLSKQVDWKDHKTLREFNKLLSNGGGCLQQDLLPLASGEVIIDLVAQLGDSKIASVVRLILMRLLIQLKGQLHPSALVNVLGSLAKLPGYTDLILKILDSLPEADLPNLIGGKIWFDLTESAAISLNLNQSLIEILGRNGSKFSAEILLGTLRIAIKCRNSGLVHQLIDIKCINGVDESLLQLLQDIRLYGLTDSSAFQKAARYCTEAVLSQNDLGPFQRFLTFILQYISKDDAELSLRIVNRDVIDWTASNASKIISQMIALYSRLQQSERSQKEKDIAAELVKKSQEKSSSQGDLHVSYVNKN